MAINYVSKGGGGGGGRGREFLLCVRTPASNTRNKGRGQRRDGGYEIQTFTSQTKKGHVDWRDLLSSASVEEAARFEWIGPIAPRWRAAVRLPFALTVIQNESRCENWELRGAAAAAVAAAKEDPRRVRSQISTFRVATSFRVGLVFAEGLLLTTLWQHKMGK